MRLHVPKEVFQEYSRSRERAQLELEHRTSEVYNQIPRIAEIDRQLGQVSMDIARWILKHPEDSQKGSQEIRTTLEALQRERTALLASRGLSDQFLEMTYQCPLCRDTGYTPDNKTCRCLRQKLIDRAYRNSNLGTFLQNQNFNTFDLSLFSDTPMKGKERSPRENIRLIKEKSQEFIDQFESNSTKNLVFYGGTGQGKTFLCSCIARALLDKGYTVLYQTSFRIAEVMSSYKFGNQDNADAESSYRLIYDCDLLIIDDLGTEMTNTFTNSEFFNILNSRLMSQKKMIFSTNLSPIEWIRTYGDRISSRMMSQFSSLEFYGSDLRFIKK